GGGRGGGGGGGGGGGEGVGGGGGVEEIGERPPPLDGAVDQAEGVGRAAVLQGDQPGEVVGGDPVAIVQLDDLAIECLRPGVVAQPLGEVGQADHEPGRLGVLVDPLLQPTDDPADVRPIDLGVAPL